MSGEGSVPSTSLESINVGDSSPPSPVEIATDLASEEDEDRCGRYVSYNGLSLRRSRDVGLSDHAQAQLDHFTLSRLKSKPISDGPTIVKLKPKAHNKSLQDDGERGHRLTPSSLPLKKKREEHKVINFGNTREEDEVIK
ncbi:hypothetical protein Rs2_40909 [Raphanus sativus]|nr:hypothetical protein Rs2_40909 [Raphanus sativus]